MLRINPFFCTWNFEWVSLYIHLICIFFSCFIILTCSIPSDFIFSCEKCQKFLWQPFTAKPWTVTSACSHPAFGPLSYQNKSHITASFPYSSSAVLRIERVGISYDKFHLWISSHYGLLTHQAYSATSFYLTFKGRMLDISNSRQHPSTAEC
jgi:hypothetical protein